MILGHGVDIIRIGRVENLLERFPRRFPRKVYTSDEIDYCQNRASSPPESFAARLAAKEAVYKVLSPELEVLRWKEIEVKVKLKKDGGPELQLSGNSAELSKKMGITAWHLSLSHERQYALASVIAEGG